MVIEIEMENRLEEMEIQKDPSDTYWPEKYKDSRKELVVFVRPNLGGKEVTERCEIKT